jgi:murein L,D-transpeptidase YafK
VVDLATPEPEAVIATREPAAAGETAVAAEMAEVAPAEDAGRAEAVPAALVYLPEGVPDVLVVDKSAHRLYHYRGTATGPRQVAGYPCVVGKRAGRKEVAGDLRTPEGVYFIEERLTDAQLAPRYGVLAYPTDYPNSFDRLAGRRGNGIWLHGTDEPERLALRDDSRGCVVLANDDLLALSRAVREGRTPVVVVAAIDWVEPQASAARAAQVTGWLDRWRGEWEQGHLEAYRARYGPEFFRLAHTRPSTWLRRKRMLLQAEGRREIELAGVTILRSREQLVVACSQTYRSPRHTDTGTKRIYLAADGGDYRIVAEKWLPAG